MALFLFLCIVELWQPGIGVLALCIAPDILEILGGCSLFKCAYDEVKGFLNKVLYTN